MKTSTSSLVARYIWLLNIIYEAGPQGISRADINRLWRGCIYNENHEREIARKTFYNYKCEIESLFEISLEAVRLDGHFRYRIAEEDSLQVNQVKRMLLNSLSINEAVSAGSEMSDRILLEDIPSAGGVALPAIMQALRTSRALNIVHKSFKPDALPVASTVYPVCLKLREQRWYMLAYKPADGQARVYGLDRIGECSVSSEKFDARKVVRTVLKGARGAVPEDYFRDYYGVVIDDTVPLMDVRVRVFTEQYVNYFRSLPLHASQVEVGAALPDAAAQPSASRRRKAATKKGPEISEPFSDFMYHIHPTIDFTRKLLSYGQFVQVISPADYAGQVADMVRRAAGRYR